MPEAAGTTAPARAGVEPALVKVLAFIFTVFITGYILIPILVTLIMSFNDAAQIRFPIKVPARHRASENKFMRTLRQRLLITLLGWLTLVLAVLCVVVFLLARQSVQGDVDQFVRDKAYLLGQQVNPAYPAGIFYDEKPWRSDRYFAFGQTFDTNWNLLYKSTRLVGPILPTEDVKRYATHPTGVLLHDATGPDGTEYRMATVRIERNRTISLLARLLNIGHGDTFADSLGESPVSVILYVGLPSVAITIGLIVAWRYWSWLLAERG